MDSRVYFVLGDLLSNIAIGALIGLVAVLVVGTQWNMWLAMFLMMVVGMAISFPLSLAFGIYFGAMEIMVPAMLTGMMSGMVVGMWHPMSPLSVSEGAIVGALTGLIVLNAVWVANTALRGVRKHGGAI